MALHDYFDLVAGTSTGSIITAAIASKLDAAEIVQIYKKSADSIFPYREPIAPLFQKIISFVSGPKFDNNGLQKALHDMLGDKSISEIVKPIKDEEAKSINDEVGLIKPIILILAYDMLYRNTTFFTNFHPDAEPRWYDDIPLWQICMS